MEIFLRKNCKLSLTLNLLGIATVYLINQNVFNKSW